MGKQVRVSGDFTQVEHVVGAAGIYPGMLVKPDSDDEIVVHNVAGDFAEVLIPIEDSLAGKAIATALTNGERAQCVIPHSGAVFMGILKTGYAVVIGEDLVSAGDGMFIPRDGLSSSDLCKAVLCRAREAKDLTVGGSVSTLIKMRRL